MLSIGCCLKLLRTQETIGDVIAICSGPVDGDTKTNSSTRAELFGIASSLLFLTLTIKFYQIDTDSEVQIWSDSVASLASLNFL